MATVSRNSRWLRVRGGKPTSNSPCLLACQKAVSLWCYKPYDDDDESDFRKWFSILEYLAFSFQNEKKKWKPCSTIIVFFSILTTTANPKMAAYPDADYLKTTVGETLKKMLLKVRWHVRTRTVHSRSSGAAPATPAKWLILFFLRCLNEEERNKLFAFVWLMVARADQPTELTLQSHSHVGPSTYKKYFYLLQPSPSGAP